MYVVKFGWVSIWFLRKNGEWRPVNEDIGFAPYRTALNLNEWKCFPFKATPLMSISTIPYQFSHTNFPFSSLIHILLDNTFLLPSLYQTFLFVPFITSEITFQSIWSSLLDPLQITFQLWIVFFKLFEF